MRPFSLSAYITVPTESGASFRHIVQFAMPPSVKSPLRKSEVEQTPQSVSTLVARMGPSVQFPAYRLPTMRTSLTGE